MPKSIPLFVPDNPSAVPRPVDSSEAESSEHLLHHGTEIIAVFRQAVDLSSLKVQLLSAGFQTVAFQIIITKEAQQEGKNHHLAYAPEIAHIKLERAELLDNSIFLLQADIYDHHIIQIQFPDSVGGSKDQAWMVLQNFECYYAIYNGLWESWKKG